MHSSLATSRSSPDGQTLAFTKRVWQGTGIYTVPVSGGQEQRIIADDTDHWGVAWTPDGRDIVLANASWPITTGWLWKIPLQNTTPKSGKGLTNSALSVLCYNPASEETTLTNLSGIMKQLSKERDRLHQQLSGLNAALEAFAGVHRGNKGIKPRRKISAAGRARIAAAQRARWAKAKGVAVPKRRMMSASARRKIAAAQRARWATVKQGKKAA